MERWEVIERGVLIAVAAALIALSAWLFTVEGQAVFAVLLLPVIFWVLWQAFFEDKLDSKEPVSRLERFLYLTYLWGRRMVLGFVSFFFAMVAFEISQTGKEFATALLFAGLSLFAAWVAVFGAGRSKSMSDDLSTYRERRRRYR